MQWRLFLVPGALAVVLSVVGFAAFSHRADAHHVAGATYQGSVPGALAISLTTTDDGTTLDPVHLVLSCGGVVAEIDGSIPLGLPGSDHPFIAPIQHGGDFPVEWTLQSFQGSFPSAGQAEGTYSFRVELLGAGLCSTSGNWTATLVDSDGDGCADAREQQTSMGSELSGGRRNPNNPNDYFNPSGDRVNRVDDILLVVQAYFADDNDATPGMLPYAAGYNPATDRSNMAATPHEWTTGAPDGLQRVQDILHSVNSYFHDCV